MLKKDLVNVIMNEVNEVEYCTILRVYGVSHGVGYDMTVRVSFNNGTNLYLDVHAVRGSWAVDGHLRPNNAPYEYTGPCDCYQEQIIAYWLNKDGFREWLGRLSKKALERLHYEKGFNQ